MNIIEIFENKSLGDRTLGWTYGQKLQSALTTEIHCAGNPRCTKAR